MDLKDLKVIAFGEQDWGRQKWDRKWLLFIISLIYI